MKCSLLTGVFVTRICSRCALARSHAASERIPGCVGSFPTSHLARFPGPSIFPRCQRCLFLVFVVALRRQELKLPAFMSAIFVRITATPSTGNYFAEGMNLVAIVLDEPEQQSR